MYFVHPNDPERFALRILLLYRKGLDSFEKLRTVNGLIFPTYKEACFALGYLNDDSEAKLSLEEAVNFATASQIRELFVLILLNCTPANPRNLWDTYKNSMSEDFLYNYRKTNNNMDLEITDEIYNITLNSINELLQKSGNEIANYSNMPEIKSIWRPVQFEKPNQLLIDELNYNQTELKDELNDSLIMLNPEQKAIYNTIISRLNTNEYDNNAFFIDGPGGCGK